MVQFGATLATVVLGLGVIHSTALVPELTARQPNISQPLAGLPTLTGAEHHLIHTASVTTGTYSHGAQIERHAGVFHVCWDAGTLGEDKDGQYILYAASTDGRNWSRAVELFPPMPQHVFGCPRALHHARPFVTLNGRLYAVTNVHNDNGWAVFYPVPSRDLGTTLLRRVVLPARLTPGGCYGNQATSSCPASEPRWTQPVFGQMFWATPVVPPGFENVSLVYGIRRGAPSELTPEEVQDLTLFTNVTMARSFSRDGCQNGPCADGTHDGCENEQTVYTVNETATDVILYRADGTGLLNSTSRDTSNKSTPWSPDVPTNIPDIGSNLNAGSFPDGRVYLVWNGVVRPRVTDPTGCGYTVDIRNPLTLALSSDGGLHFDRMFALFNSTSPKRYCGWGKDLGVSYPQAQMVTGEEPDVNGLWTVYSVNKEDIGITFVPESSLH